MSESTLHSEKGRAAMLNQVMAVLNRIGQTLVAIEDLPETLKEIARSAQEVLGADIVDLYEYVQERNEFVLPPILIGDRRDPFAPKIKIYDDDVVMEAVKLGEPQYFDNAQERALTSKFKIPRADAPAQRFVIREGVASSATVPLKAVAETVGVMFVNYRTRQVFDPEQKNVIESFANLAAIAIHNARLLRLQRERKRQAETLQQVAQTVNSSLSLAEVIDRVLEQLGNVMEYDSASVQLVQGERRTTVGGRGFDIGGVPYELRRNISDDPLIGRIVREKRALVLSDVGQESVWHPIPATAHIRSWIGAPLVFKDQVIGLLMLDHKKAGYYTQESGEIVAAFANQVAAAIRNSAQARALAELNKLSQRLVSIEESPQDTRNLLQQIADSALEILQADMIDLYEYLQGQCEFKLPQVFAGKKLVEGVPKDKVEQDDVVARLIREERPLYIQSTQTDETFSSTFVVDRKGKPPERFAVREKIQSTAAVPLRTRDETVGLLFANYRTPQEFTTEQRELVELFANQAAIAVRNARLFETRQRLNAQLESQIERLKTLNQVGGALSTRLDTEFIYEAVAKAVVQTLDCTHCTIFVLEHDQLVPHASYGKGKGSPVTRRFAQGEGMIGWVIRERRSLLVRDAKKHELFVAGQTRPQVDRSIIVVPIKAGEQVIGAISADQDRINAFDERDRQMVETLALQAGIALQNARRIQDLEIVNNVARDISAQLDTQALFETIVSRIAEQLNCTHCTLFLLQEQDGKLWLVPQKTHGVRPEIMERKFRPDEGLAGWVLQHGESLVLPDVRQDARFAPARKVRESPRSMLVAPVKFGDRTIGVISADQDQFDWFSENGRRLVDTLAQQAAIAIENARLFRQVQQRVDALTLLQKVSAGISATLKLDEILPLILAGAMRLTGASSGIVRLLGENEQIIEPSFELPEGFKHPAPRLANPNSMTRRTIDSRQPVVVPDVTQDDRVSPDVAAKGVRSMISLPLTSKGKVVGILGLNGDRLNQFEENQSLLLTLADQAAIAIENAELYRHISQDLERKIGELEVLTEMSRGAVSNLGIDQILDLVYEQTAKVMDLSNAQVQFAFYDEAKDEVSFPLAIEQDNSQTIDVVRWGKRHLESGKDEEAEQFKPRARGKRLGLTEYVIHHKQPISIAKDFEQAIKKLRVGDATVQVWPTFGRLDRPTCSWLGVPMMIQGRVIGIISIQSLEQEHAFDQGHLELLYTVANQAAVAIENAKLYIAGQRYIERLKLIQKIALDMSSALELQEVLYTIAEGANLVSGADFTTIFPYNPEQGFEEGISVGVWKAAPDLPSKTGWAAQVVTQLAPVIIEDVEQTPGPKRAFWEQSGVHSFVAYPIQFTGKPVGLMFVNFVQPHTFTQSELEWIHYVANQAVIAIQNAKSFARVAEVERLQIASLMTADFAHRLGNYLGTIPAKLEAIEREFLSSPEPCEPEKITHELKSIVNEISVTRNELRSALETPFEQKPQKVNLNTLLQSVAIRVAANSPDKVEFHEDYEKDLPLIVCHSTVLFEAVRTIVENAVDAALEAGEHSEVLISSRRALHEDGKVYVEATIKDTGRGIPKSEMPHLFELFHTTKPGGVGYGLWRARNVVRQLGGDILLSSEPGQGTTVLIMIPVERVRE